MGVYGSRSRDAAALAIVLLLVAGCSGGAASLAPSTPPEPSSPPSQESTAAPTEARVASPSEAAAPTELPTTAFGAVVITLTISGDDSVADTYTFESDGTPGPPDAAGVPIWPVELCSYSTSDKQWIVKGGRQDVGDLTALRENVYFGVLLKAETDPIVYLVFGNGGSADAWNPIGRYGLPPGTTMPTVSISEEGQAATITVEGPLAGFDGRGDIDFKLRAECDRVARS